jgi:glycosyltransferase involved in cell wall biosynthesis
MDLISKTQFIANKTNLGSTKSFNKALNKSNGDYIIDLATDDVYYHIVLAHK